MGQERSDGRSVWNLEVRRLSFFGEVFFQIAVQLDDDAHRIRIPQASLWDLWQQPVSE